MLSARYGVEGGRLKEGGREGSVMWRELVRIYDRVDFEEAGLFDENLWSKVGNRDNTFSGRIGG